MQNPTWGRARAVASLLASSAALVAGGCGSEEPSAEASHAAIAGERDAGLDGGRPEQEAVLPDATNPTLDPSQPPDAGLGGRDDDGVDRDVLRPTPRAPTEALIRSLALPPGFALGVYARDLGHARMLAVHGPHVYLTRPRQGDVLRLEDADEDGEAERTVVVASGLPDVHGIAFHEPYVYLATPTHVYRASVDASGSFGTPVAIIDDLPAGGQHPNRTLGIGPDQKLYISVGSPCDACPIDDPEYATMLRSELDGSRRELVARGLRNTLGFGWHPTTRALWGMDHGSDFRGDDLPPEELNLIEEGEDYGWPYCFADRQIDPVIQDPPGSTKEAYCARTTGPVLTNQAHEAPIALAFYAGRQFPPHYREGAFVAFRGSWNRIPATGYKIGFIAFESGFPVRIEDFVRGFLIEDGRAQFGRLAGVAVAPDGSLLFTDDDNGYVYRVSYVGTPSP